MQNIKFILIPKSIFQASWEHKELNRPKGVIFGEHVPIIPQVGVFIS